MSNDKVEPSAGADPGGDPIREIRAVKASKPKVGCLGLTGGSAILAMTGLVLALIYMVSRCGS